MTTRRKTVKVYLTAEERDTLDRDARTTGLTRSELIRRILAGRRLPDASTRQGWQDVRDLLRINADLARLGNLVKLTVDEAPAAKLLPRLQTLSEDITTTQALLKDTVLRLRKTLA